MPEVRETVEATDIARNLHAVWDDIGQAAGAAGRDPAETTLCAVTKAVAINRIRLAIAAGQRVFGENRVQEAGKKWPELRDVHNDVILHLIGPLQTNKVAKAVALFDVIETLDRPKLARALAEEREKLGSCPLCYIQINIGAETQKAGVLPDQADTFINSCRDEFGLPIVGLMCVPPINEEPSLHFSLLREIAFRHGLDGLSMGMSADFKIAIAFGATIVRVGTAIFGSRSSLSHFD